MRLRQDAKYADVIPLREALEYINGLPDTLYAPGL